MNAIQYYVIRILPDSFTFKLQKWFVKYCVSDVNYTKPSVGFLHEFFYVLTVQRKVGIAVLCIW